MTIIDYKKNKNYKTIILDRDGVINKVKEDYVKIPAELQFITGSIAAINDLVEKNYNVVVASNQSVVGRGLITEVQLFEIERKINRSLKFPIKFYYCLHHPRDLCLCRKPNVGLLDKIKSDYVGEFLFIGDNVSDYGAAKAADIDFWYVKTGYGSVFSQQAKNIVSFDDLSSAAAALCTT